MTYLSSLKELMNPYFLAGMLVFVVPFLIVTVTMLLSMKKQHLTKFIVVLIISVILALLILGFSPIIINKFK